MNWSDFSFDHALRCPRAGWLTKQQIAAVIGVGVQHFDRTYRPRYSYTHYVSPEGEVAEPTEREEDGKLLFTDVIVNDMVNDGVFDQKSGPRMRSITCPECGATLGMKPKPQSGVTP